MKYTSGIWRESDVYSCGWCDDCAEIRGGREPSRCRCINDRARTGDSPFLYESMETDTDVEVIGAVLARFNATKSSSYLETTIRPLKETYAAWVTKQENPKDDQKRAQTIVLEILSTEVLLSVQSGHVLHHTVEAPRD